MTLKEWKKENRFTFDLMAEETGIHKAKLLRIVNEHTPCVRLVDAHRIVKMTNGQVDYCDLLTGDC